MNTFKVISKLWPSGNLLNGGVLVSTVTSGSNVICTAPPLAAGPGAPDGYRFLFWNTGRRVTNKLMVTWTFNNLPSWTTWIATRWYGIIPGVGGGPNPKLITTTAFAMEDDASMSGTPIDGVNSTFTNDPNSGQQAYPFGIPPNDRVASTQWGAASVVALDPFPHGLVFKQYLFAGWLQLILGGDEIGQFDESDGATIGGGSLYSHLTAGPVTVIKDETVDLMAAYRVINLPPIQRDPLERISFIEWLLDYDRLVDPRLSPFGGAFDRIRIGALAELAELYAVTRRGNAPEDFLESLTANAQSMEPAELKRAITSAKAIMRRAVAATKSLEAALSKRGE